MRDSHCLGVLRRRVAQQTGIRWTGAPRPLSALVMPFRLVTPAACNSAMMGATAASLLAARHQRCVDLKIKRERRLFSVLVSDAERSDYGPQLATSGAANLAVPAHRR
jgi:hypothetical protein